MSNTLYESCAVASNGTVELLMQCIADKFDEDSAANRENTENWLLVIAGALVFFMQAGFAMLCAGCVRKKNVQNTMLKNLLDACGAAVAFYFTGYGFAFGKPMGEKTASFFGTTDFVMAAKEVSPAFWFFQYAFSATAVTIVAGTLAERCQMAAYLCYSVFLTGFVYPVAARTIWSEYGFLSVGNVDPIGGLGVLDFAGSGVVHMTGGMTALISAYLLGARKGRFTDSRGRPLDTPKEFPGHSIALQLMGTMILWFGWYGFNPGSALLLGIEETGQVAALSAVNTSLAAGMGAVSALFSNLYLEERRTGDYSFNLTMALNGLLSGLVAVTASCGFIEPFAAILIGLISGWIYIGASALLLRWKIDDAVDAVPVHLFNGGWGLIAAGLFASPSRLELCFGKTEHIGWLYSLGQGSSDFGMLGTQILGLFFVIGWPTVIVTPFFIWLNYMGWLRADSLEELVGLDMSYHGGKKALQVNDADDDINDEDMQEFERRRKQRNTYNFDDDDDEDEDGENIFEDDDDDENQDK